MATTMDQVPRGDIQKEPETVEEAKEILWQISGELGGPPGPIEDELNTTSAPTQKYVTGLQRRVRKDAEKMIKVLVQSIYSGASRYLYELIQNADDASYALAAGRRETPSLTFTLTNEYLYVDTNEDGFNSDNVKAICAIGESTKKVSYDDDSIGEKGIGFKSVYSIAQSVHIQSGVWSFRFDNDRNDPLSMFIPQPVRGLPLSEEIRTRIAIRYCDGYTNRIVKALRGLSHDTVMFLRKITRLTIQYEVIQSAAEMSSKVIFRRQPSVLPTSGQIVTLSTIRDLKSDSSKNRYRLYKHAIPNMPEDPRRQKSTVEMQLAFPVNRNGDKPLISLAGETMFAFLPMWKERQLPFIIQSDFITTPSRESTANCDWNDEVLGYIAQAFVASIHDLIKLGDGFSYSWLNFLPPEISTGPLSSVLEQIRALLWEESVLYAWSEEKLATPHRLRILPAFFIHDQQPLFHDTAEQTVYLSPRYDNSLIPKLRDLGLEDLSWDELIARLSSDVLGSSSTLKCTPLDDDWHAAFANFIEKALVASAKPKNGLKRIANAIRGLPIIPLSDGTWAKPSETIYFPQLDDLNIPSDLAFDLVDPQALLTGAQRELYESLEVSDCDPSDVCARIINLHRRTSIKGSTSTTTLNVLSHLQFLHKFSPSVSRNDRKMLIAETSNGKFRRAKSGLFFPSDHEYHAERLIDTVRLKDSTLITARDRDKVLHGEFMTPENIAVFHHGLKWEEWLAQILSIRYYPSLVGGSEEPSLSPIMSKVIEADSRIFLGTLRAHWVSSYASEVKNAGKVFVDYLRAQPVLCSDGSSRPLEKTFPPHPQLVQLADELGFRNFMPFLELSGSEFVLDEWKFLEKFDVQFGTDRDFWLQAIRSLKMAEYLPPDRIRSSARRIYEEIGRIASQKDHEFIFDFFVDGGCICNPQDSSDWRSPEECRWKGPDFDNKYILLGHFFESSAAIKNLFTTILYIKDMDRDDVVDELRSIKDDETWQVSQSDGNFETAKQRMMGIYEAVNAFGWKSKGNKKWLSEQFDTWELLYIDGSWYKPKDCIWDLAIADSGRPKVRACYANLQSLFVDVVGVQTVSAIWLIEELLTEAIKPSPDISIVKDLFCHLGTMLASSNEKDDIDVVKAIEFLGEGNVKFLPIKGTDGKTSLMGLDDSFVINDHDGYARKFADHVSVLDFDLDETRKLATLITMLDLEERYLSLCVERFSEPMTSHIDDRKTRDFRMRAYALACCAAKYKSKLYTGSAATHNRVLQAQVHVSYDLRTQIRLKVPGGEPIFMPDDRTVPELTGVETGDIVIYLPTAKKDLKRAYSASLPGQLCRVLGIEDPIAYLWIHQLLTVKLGAVPEVLDQAEAPSLSWLDAIDLSGEEGYASSEESEELDDQTVVASEIDGASVVQDEPRLNDHDPLQQSHSTVPHSGSSLFPRETALPERPLPTLQAQLPQRPISPSQAVRTSPNDFLRLLNNVVCAARMGQSHGMFSDAADVSDRALVFGDPIEPGNEHLATIGAIGELFVYESLRMLDLTDFGYANWPSKIRRLIKVHPEHANMPDFSGQDMDLVLEDDSRQFQEWLTRNSYGFCPQLPRNPDGSRMKIRYELEVKSTLGSLSETMFMSHEQYARMHSHRLANNEWSGTVFVLVRVYNLLSQHPKVKLYIDPTRFGRNVLSFKRGKWEVEARTPTTAFR